MYDDDLTNVVLNVHRRNAVATSKLANHPLTRAYLEAGVRVLKREFSAKRAEGDERFLRPLSTLTRDTVIAEVANGPAELPRQGTVGSFRDRWAYFPDYVSDLARYKLRAEGMPWDAMHAEAAAAALKDGDFVATVHEIAYRRMCLAMQSTALRFRYSLTALAAQDEKVCEAMASMYEDVTGVWARTIENMLSERNLVLRPGVSARDIAVLVSALNDGLALRLASAPDTTVLDDAHRRAILGKAALALFSGCVDTGDGASLEEVAERIASGYSSPP